MVGRSGTEMLTNEAGEVTRFVTIVFHQPFILINSLELSLADFCNFLFSLVYNFVWFTKCWHGFYWVNPQSSAGHVYSYNSASRSWDQTCVMRFFTFSFQFLQKQVTLQLFTHHLSCAAYMVWLPKVLLVANAWAISFQLCFWRSASWFEETRACKTVPLCSLYTLRIACSLQHQWNFMSLSILFDNFCTKFVM